MQKALEAAVVALMDEFYGPDVRWPEFLEGEALAIDVAVDGANATLETLTFSADGVRQVASPHPFDALKCAMALKQALGWTEKGGNE